MTALSAQYTLSQNAGLQQTIRMSMVGNALTVVSEARQYDVELVEIHAIKHDKRHGLASRILLDPDYYLMRFVYASCAQDTLTGASSDAQINAAVLSLFDKIAGVDVND